MSASGRGPNIRIEPDQVTRIVLLLDPQQPRVVAAVLGVDGGRPFGEQVVRVETSCIGLHVRPVGLDVLDMVRAVFAEFPRHEREHVVFRLPVRESRGVRGDPSDGTARLLEHDTCRAGWDATCVTTRLLRINNLADKDVADRADFAAGAF
mgnify:CR=1 FL=1